MEYNENYFKFLLNANKRHENGEAWADILKDFNKKFGENITKSSLSHRVKRYAAAKDKIKYKETKPEQFSKNEFTTIDGDGVLSAQRIIECQREILGDPNKLLEKLGYNPSQWDIISLTSKTWEQGQKNNNTKKNLYSIGLKLKRKNELTDTDVIDSIKTLINENIEPIEFEKLPYNKELNPNQMMEICPVELHMGKLSNADETGENYDLKICKSIFENLVIRISQIQQEKKCGRAVVIIGSDFFNSESDNMTTNKTPQQNDTRYKKLFLSGLELYTKALLTFRKLFNEVEVRICSGNHARAMEFFLYIALAQYFKDDDIINFVEDYKDTQAIQFGNCAIFYNHGDANLKRTKASMAAEFYEIWGKTIYRELHLGHLHKEVTVDDESGMITRRIGSPCATDAWHYTNRFIGAIKKHQIFIWDKNDGLQEIRYLNMDAKKY